ncbi:MAG: hypothetical protein AAFO94_10805 [Bacteroidota bacterium]
MALPLLLLALLATSYLLPAEQQAHIVDYRKPLLLLIELSVLSILLFNFRKISQKYKAARKQHRHFLEAVELGISEVYPPLFTSIMLTEVSMFYYLFGRRPSPSSAVLFFSYHRRSGIVSALAVLMAVMVMEAWVIHYVLFRWSVVLAWVLTILSVYTLLQLVATCRAVVLNPIRITDEYLLLQYAFWRKATIPIKQIKEIELSRKPVEESDELVRFSPFAPLEGHRLLIHLHESAHISGAYGYQKDAVTIALFVDDPKGFKSAMEHRMTTTK